MRNINETDDINSILKSPLIKSRKKRRKRSSWASGVIKKRKQTTRNTDNEADVAQKSDDEKSEEKVLFRLCFHDQLFFRSNFRLK